MMIEFNRWGFGARFAPRPNNNAKSGAEPMVIGNTQGVCTPNATKTSTGGRATQIAKTHPA
jgi:hypothetical protein